MFTMGSYLGLTKTKLRPHCYYFGATTLGLLGVAFFLVPSALILGALKISVSSSSPTSTTSFSTMYFPFSLSMFVLPMSKIPKSFA